MRSARPSVRGSELSLSAIELRGLRRQRLLFEMQESDHDVGHLHAGVVDVVLHIDLVAGGAQQADKRVAEDGVAQMADVRGLVGIDAGVLDERHGRLRGTDG